MKITDFGLWFWSDDNAEWSKTIPPDSFDIYYDGRLLARQYLDDDFIIFDDEPHTIKMKKYFSYNGAWWYGPLTLDDFEVVENHRYKERK